MDHIKRLIQAIATGNAQKMIGISADAKKNVRVFTTADEYLKAIYRWAMSRSEKDFGEYRLQLSGEDEKQLEELETFLLDFKNKRTCTTSKN